MAELWLGGVYVADGGVCTPMSKPECMLIGTSENLLKGVVSFSSFFHSSGIKGVTTGRRSEYEVTLLGGVSRGATQGT